MQNNKGAKTIKPAWKGRKRRCIMNTRKDIDSIFEVGKKYTVYSLNSMAMTTKLEMEVTGLETDKVIFKHKGKRKMYVFPLRSKHYSSAPLKETEAAIFEGWDQPVTCDTDGARCFRGNALFNFIAEPEAIRAWIDKGQLNPNFNRSIVLSVEADNSDSGERAVYPELYKGGHTVMDRYITK